MDQLWSASTTMRNPERTQFFLQVAAELEGEVWTHETQRRLQALLIQRRFYVPRADGLTQTQLELLGDYSRQMTYDEARDIFDSKGYTDPPMRGRTSFSPLVKLGLATLDNGNRIQLTELGRMFLNGEVSLGEATLSFLLKFQLPNPLSRCCQNYNTKPFINTLRLIRRVNELCRDRGEKEKGVSADEFGIFVLSIRTYTEVEQRAKDLLDYRQAMSAIRDQDAQEAYRTEFVQNYLPTFQQPAQNTREYADNIIRYLRLTSYIYIRGGGYYVDLEPRRRVEIDALLAHDDGSARPFTRQEYTRYMADLNAYQLPFETPEQLAAIAKEVAAEVASLESALGLPPTAFALASGVRALKAQIRDLREQRVHLHNQKLKLDYQQAQRIDEAINALGNIRRLGGKPSIELEKWSSIALNIIDDAELIQPNAPLGDDNEPTFTAPAGVPDIECFYQNFGAICEVTMLTGRDQWFNEGQPVMRHLRDFEDSHSAQENYCLFVAPTLHRDTLNTFWMSIKHEYEGRKQKIVPLTIRQLIHLLEGVKEARDANYKVCSADMRQLYDACTALDGVPDSTAWTAHVEAQLKAWHSRVTAPVS